MTDALRRIEHLYANGVGAAHFARVKTLTFPRGPFWRDLLAQRVVTSVLEVGSGAGVNARYLSRYTRYSAIDISPVALRETQPYSSRLSQASAASLPFPDCSFDLVVSAGLLMHTPKDALDAVMGEQARVSRKYVLLCEYDDQNGMEREIDWHGIKGALWSRPIGTWWWNRNPEFVPVERRELTREDGFDRTAMVLFRRRAAGVM